MTWLGIKKLRVKYVYILGTIWLLLIASTLLCTFLVGAGMALLAFNLLLVILALYSAVLIVHNKEASFLAFLPLLFSGVQNIYLGIIAHLLTDYYLSVLLIANVIYAGIIIAVLVIQRPRQALRRLPFMTISLAILLILYGLLSYFIFGGYFISALASLRNILSPLIFFLLGTLLADRICPAKFFKYVAILTWFILIFGIIERFVLPDLWHYLNIGELWSKKGIRLHPSTGFPYNFYAAEKIGELYLRRMTSSFADPVNLGTVLFFSFMVAWYSQRKVLSCLCIPGIFLVISKGALLGLMIFSVVWAYYRWRRVSFFFLLMLNILAGVSFLFYSLNYATASLVTHVMGFYNALKLLPGNIFGHGIGNVGVLAGLFSDLEVTEIKESGLGVIIGQYGLMGIGIFGFFFWKLFQQLYVLKEKENKIFGYSLFLAIVFNIFFNEVALSPNSSAGYFLVLGLLCMNAISSANSREGV